MKLSAAQKLNPAAWVILWIARAWNRRGNPTRGFPASRATRVTVSADAPAPRSLHPRMALRELESLGPADWQFGPATFRRLLYYELGVMLQLADDRVGMIEVLLDPARHPFSAVHGFRPGTLELLRGGRRLALLDANVSESQLRSLLGAPTHSESLDDRRVLGFALDAIELEAELDARSRRVVAVSITARDPA